MSAESPGFSFENKNAFVTGTSRGLGEQIAVELMKKEAYVIGTSRSEPPESFRSYMEQGKADYERGDLVEKGDQVVRNIYNKHQGYEIFVNNAGSFSPDFFTHTDPARIIAELRIDLVAPLLLLRYWFGMYDEFKGKAKAPELAINILSISSLYAWAGGTGYQTAKGGLAKAIWGLRAERKNLNEKATDEVKKQVGPSADVSTRFVGIYPDNVATGLIARAQQESLYQVQGDALPPEIVVQTIMQAIDGQGKFGEYDDIAILVNPNKPGTREPLKGVYLAFLPINEETHEPDFGKRILEKIADEEVLIKR